MILLKANKKNFALVLKKNKHATKGRPRNVKIGEIVLLARLRKDIHGLKRPITHKAIYLGICVDVNNKTDAIWGEHRRYIINLDCITELEKPFDIRDVSTRNYDQAQTSAKIDEPDAEMILEGGYLRPLVTSTLDN